VTKELLKIDPDAKVIFISADFSVRASALEAGAVTFIKKPASLKVITDTIDQVLRAYPQAEF
jgi:FixJ family two-component response regulator